MEWLEFNYIIQFFQPGAPAVNRSLKPKLNLEEKGPGEEKSPLRPPSIDRKLKPAAYKVG